VNLSRFHAEDATRLGVEGMLGDAKMCTTDSMAD
jgi:hypothetical protein